MVRFGNPQSSTFDAGKLSRQILILLILVAGTGIGVVFLAKNNAKKVRTAVAEPSAKPANSQQIQNDPSTFRVTQSNSPRQPDKQLPEGQPAPANAEINELSSAAIPSPEGQQQWPETMSETPGSSFGQAPQTPDAPKTDTQTPANQTPDSQTPVTQTTDTQTAEDQAPEDGSTEAGSDQKFQQDTLASTDPLTLIDPQQLGELLADVRDRNLSWSKEWAVFFEVLSRLEAQDPQQLQAELQRQGRGTAVTFPQLAQQPGEYRGKLVLLEGVARSAFTRQAGPNDAGIDRYYEVWISTTDGNSLFRVYLLELPSSFPLSKIRKDQISGDQPNYTQLNEPVEVTGVFFRVGVYRSVRGVDDVPIVLAKTMDWKRETLVAFQNSSSPSVLEVMPWLVGLTLAAAVLATMVIFIRSGNQAKAEAQQRMAGINPEGFRSMPDLETLPPTEDHLKELAKNAPDEKAVWEQMAGTRQ